MVAITALALAGHVAFLRSAGALWRDEASTVAFARLPSLALLWTQLKFDSVPLASTLLVRGWIGLGLASDAALRILGCLIGVALLGSLLAGARAARLGLPVFSLGLVALNPWVIRGGDAIRPTGLGALFIVLNFMALAAALERPSPRRAALAVLAAILSVHSLYADLPLVAALAAAGATTGFATRSRARVVVSATVLAAAALSLVPYRSAVESARAWSELVQGGSGMAQWMAAFREAAAPDVSAWLLLLPLAVILAALQFARPGERFRHGEAQPAREGSLYAAASLVAGALFSVMFFAWTRLELEPWYFVPWMAVSAAAADVALGRALRARRLEAPAAVVLVALSAAHLFIEWEALGRRQTNVDEIAARVRDRARPGDLVLVSPWYLSLTFSRYYDGPIAWRTVPALEEKRIHRFDRMKQAMQTPEIIDASVAAVDSTLRAGGTIWLVGGLPRIAPGATDRRAPTAPAPGIGWSLRAYTAIWSNIVLDELRDHAAMVEAVALDSPRPIQPREDERLFRASGWR